LQRALAKYERERKLDAHIISGAMDLFYQAFSKDIAPLRNARNLVLKLVQNNQWLKQVALKKAVGLGR
jgi:3-demethoxyubiquinol 3-hydroxylase